MHNPASLVPPVDFSLSDDGVLTCPPTDCWLKASELFQSSLENTLKYSLFKPIGFPVHIKKGKPEEVVYWVPGFSACDAQYGPRRRHSVMAIFKMPFTRGQPPVVSDMYKYTMSLFKEANICTDDWYITYACRFIPPDGGKKLADSFIKDSRCLLAQEIDLVKPEYILLMGADATRAVVGGGVFEKMRSNFFYMPGVRALRSPLVEYKSLEEKPVGGSKVLVTIHPGAISRESGLKPGFFKDLELLTNMHAGVEVKPECYNYKYIDKPDILYNLCKEVVEKGHKELAIDCEWGGPNPQVGKLRTIQFCWKPLEACSVILRRCGGVEAQSPVERAGILKILQEFFPKFGIIGHNFREDAKWLHWHGINLIENLTSDTMLLDHALNENAEHGLESLSVRFTSLGRYDYPLHDWLDSNGFNEKKLAARGYLDVPDDMLHLYGCQDVDCTLRANTELLRLLNLPENAGTKHLYYNTIIPSNLPIHEEEINGVLVDEKLLSSLCAQYAVKQEELLTELKSLLNRPEFNPRSPIQVSKLLFKEMGLTPYKTTEKPTRMWADLTEDQRERLSPATDAETLEALAINDKTGIISVLRDYKIIDQMCKNFLSMPEIINGEEVYTQGLLGYMQPDKCVHTTISQMSETGRDKSSNPNCQNFPKKQNSEFERIMGESIPKIRAGIIAPPGHILVECDFKSAEIYTLGYLANCPKMVKDADSDLHARGAVTDFGVPKWDGFDEGKKPTPEWKAEYDSERIASKTVRFGIPYQRGPAAIAREITKSTKGKMKCSRERAQELIDGYYAMYPEVRTYVDMCKRSVLDPGILYNPYGRCRRFFGIDVTDRSFVAACQRELVNFPIQSTVADALNRARVNFYYWRRFNPGLCDYKILLAIHDAMLLAVPGEQADVLIDRVIPECMTYGSVVPSWIPCSYWTPTKEFTLDTDIEYGVRWQVHPTTEELKAANVCDRLIEKAAKKKKK